MGAGLRQGLWLILAVAGLLAAMAAKGMLIALPIPPAAPEAGEFDANRAFARLGRILGDERPHPVDSPANDAVRERLIAEMRAVGLAPRITDDFACNNFFRNRVISCARVRNLVATIGPAEGPHLLLSAHYESSIAGPGAADAGIGVASLLETARALRGQRLDRPVTFLFNEGEESGLIGARAFLARDPLAGRIDTLINLEARGVNGPAIMFETSRPNAAAVALYRAAVDRPVANSLTADLYSLIPNSTDVTVFADRSWRILNFAIIGNETRYHTAGDDLAALDRRSLQHMGAQTLAVSRTVAMGKMPTATGTWLYGDVTGRFLVVLPQAAGLALLGLLIAFFAVTSWRRAALRRPLATILVAFLGGQVLAWVATLVLGLVRSGDYWRAHPIAIHLAVYACAMAATLLALRFVAKDSSVARLRAAWWLLFTLFGAALAAIAPGSAIFFLAPPLAMAIGVILGRRWPSAEGMGAYAAILLVYISLGPVLDLLEELLNGGPHWLFAPLGATILIPVLIELKPLIDRIRPAFVAAGAGDLVLIGWLIVALVPAYSADRQQAFVIDYVWDGAANRGHWTVTTDGAPIPYAANWSRIELPYSARRRWAIDAPPVPTPAPAITLVGQRNEGPGRRLRVRLATNGAENVALIAPASTVLRAAGSGGFVLPFGRGDAEDRWILRCVGRSCDGAELDILTRDATPIEFLVVGTRSGLPPAAAPLLQSRPATARPQYATDSTISYEKLRL